MLSLHDIALKHKPTKLQHNYLETMDKHFKHIRHKAKKVLEIGVQTNRSVRTFKEYFENATIYGVDIDPKCKEYEEDRIKIFIGNQGDKKFLETLPDDLDVIIDDGSHQEFHVLTSLHYLFPNKLKN